MVHRTLLPIILVAAAGCVTEPSAAPLVGEFGGRLLAVSASDTAVHHRFACWDARTGPLRPDRSGLADGRGTAAYRGTSWTARFSVLVRQRGDSLLVVASFVTDGSDWTESYTVRRNAPPDFSGVRCLAAT